MVWDRHRAASPPARYHWDVRRFHQPNGVVLGYDEAAFSRAGVQALREAWRARLAARTMPFLRADRAAPAALLVSFGTFPDFGALAALGRRLQSEEFAPARWAVVELFKESHKKPVEFQFRCDVGGAILRGRFVPTEPAELNAALCGLEALAAELSRVGLPEQTSLVEARYEEGRWAVERAHGFDRASGRLYTFRLVTGAWCEEER